VFGPDRIIAGVASPEDVIGQLERLQNLRDSGVITQAELDAQKAALIGGPHLASCEGCGAPLKVTPAGRCVYCGTVAPPAAAAGAPVAAAGNDAIADALFAANPGKKIQAIKALREQTGLGLKEAKDLIDQAERRAGR
jgi:hypothetical protein